MAPACVKTAWLTFALIIRPQDDQDIFESDHQGQGPEHEGQYPDQVVTSGCIASKRTGEDVERACADVSIDDT